MKHSKLARLIAGNDRSSTRPANDKQPTRQEPDTACDVDSGTDTTPAHDAKRTTTANGDKPHAANHGA